MKGTFIKFSHLIGKKNLKLSIFIIFGSFVSALLELASIGSVIPLATLIFSDDIYSIKYFGDLIKDYELQEIYIFGLFICSIFFKNSFSKFFVLFSRLVYIKSLF